jgi:RNA-binding protein Musashi
MQQMAMPSSASNPSPHQPIMVPVPYPVPFQMPQMPFAMPKPAPPQNMQVPAGFKLVRIPDFQVPETASEKKTAPIKSAISDPAKTDNKIFVGGLNPITSGQALREYFSEFGAVLDAKVIREGERSKGFGFVQFRDSIPEEVLERAHIIDQRRCGVGPAFHDGAR